MPATTKTRLWAALLAVALAVTVTALGPAPSWASSFKSRLAGAPVPSMCEYPAGTLVNGSLPGTAPGNVDLDAKRSVTGNLIKGAGTGAAAVFHCSQGGVSWPEYVVFYDRNLTIIGTFDSGTIGVYSGRAVIDKVVIRKRVAIISVAAVGQQDDSDQWGSAGATVRYAYDRAKLRMTRRSVAIYRESATAKSLLTLVRAGHLAQARKLASSQVVNGLRSLVTERSKYVRKSWVTMDGCMGPLNEDLPSSVELEFGQRACTYTIHRVSVTTGEDFSSAYMAVFEHPNYDWTRWHADGLVEVAG